MRFFLLSEEKNITCLRPNENIVADLSAKRYILNLHSRIPYNPGLKLKVLIDHEINNPRIVNQISVVYKNTFITVWRMCIIGHGIDALNAGNLVDTSNTFDGSFKIAYIHLQTNYFN